jgi:hypothetical protein
MSIRDWWGKFKSRYLVEEEPESFSEAMAEQPLPVVDVIQAPPPPPPVSHIYVKERGTGVFIPFAVFPEAFQPEAHGGVLVGCSMLRVPLSVQEVFGWLQGVNCLRGFHDMQIQALRTASPFEVTPEFLTQHGRDK